MTHFPHNPSRRRLSAQADAVAPGRAALPRDVLWGRPLFKAPSLPNPRIVFDPLPFTAARVTRASAKH
jgi:hypothetical protein